MSATGPTRRRDGAGRRTRRGRGIGCPVQGGHSASSLRCDPDVDVGPRYLVATTMATVRNRRPTDLRAIGSGLRWPWPPRVDAFERRPGGTLACSTRWSAGIRVGPAIPKGRDRLNPRPRGVDRCAPDSVRRSVHGRLRTDTPRPRDVSRLADESPDGSPVVPRAHGHVPRRRQLGSVSTTRSRGNLPSTWPRHEGLCANGFVILFPNRSIRSFAGSTLLRTASTSASACSPTVRSANDCRRTLNATGPRTRGRISCCYAGCARSSKDHVRRCELWNGSGHRISQPW